MKVRESGMPPQEVWDDFFDADGILDKLGLTSGCRDLVEFGCGYGTFTLPAARRVSGTVHTLDLDPRVLAAARQNAIDSGVENIHFEIRDFVANGTGLPDQAVDYAMLFNILHVEEPVALLHEVYRNLSEGGLLGIIHWIHNEDTPRGPPLDIRPKPEQCRSWAAAAGFSAECETIELPPYHYGLVFRR